MTLDYDTFFDIARSAAPDMRFEHCISFSTILIVHSFGYIE